MEARSFLLEQIWAQQFDDGDLCKIREKVLNGKAKATILDSEGVLRIKGHVSVPQTGDLTRLNMEEVHRLSYSIHPRDTKDLSCLEAALLVVPYERGHSRFCISVFELLPIEV